MCKVDRKEPRKQHPPRGLLPFRVGHASRGHVCLVCAVMRLRHKTPSFHYAPTPFRNHSACGCGTSYQRLRVRIPQPSPLRCMTAPRLRHSISWSRFAAFATSRHKPEARKGNKPPASPVACGCCLRGSLLHCACSKGAAFAACVGLCPALGGAKVRFTE